MIMMNAPPYFLPHGVHIIGGLVAFTLPLLVIGGFSPDNASSVQKMGIIFGILSAIHCSLYSSKRVRVTARRI